MVIPNINCSFSYLRYLVGFHTSVYIHSRNHYSLCGHYFCARNCAWHQGRNNEGMDPTWGQHRALIVCSKESLAESAQ